MKSVVKIMRYSLRPLFTCPPNSAEELFQKIKHCISVFNPEWVKKIKPDSDKDIRYLEKLVTQTYGTPLPASYKMYLQEMGAADGGLFSEYLTYEMSRFYGRMACGAADEIEDLLDRSTRGQEIKESPSEPPYWHFALSQFSGEGWGFSPSTTIPDQIIKRNGHFVAYTSDTFSSLLFYFAFSYMFYSATSHSTKLNNKTFKYLAESYSPEAYEYHKVEFYVKYPQEWATPGHTALIDFLNVLEKEFSFEECWFSGFKKFNLFDINGQETLYPWEFSRYIGFHTASDLIISIDNRYAAGENYPTSGGIRIMSQDMPCTKQIMDTILQRLELYDEMYSIQKL